MNPTTPILFLAALLTAQTGTPVDGPIKLHMTAEVEIETTTSTGTKEVKRVVPSKVVPGTEVLYTIDCTNAGATPAEAVVITNPVPEHMDYTPASAFGTDVMIDFSIDGGRTYDFPNNLVIRQPDGGTRAAGPEEYTHIRWRLQSSLRPGEIRQVGFRATLE